MPKIMFISSSMLCNKRVLGSPVNEIIKFWQSGVKLSLYLILVLGTVGGMRVEFYFILIEQAKLLI